MKIFKYLILSSFVVAAVSCISCQQKEDVGGGGSADIPSEPVEETHPDMLLKTYNYDPSDILNPERGLYCTKAFSRVSSPFTASEAKNARSRGFSLVLLEYYLGNYYTSDIAEDYLKMVRDSFQALRDGGMKCVLRFAYTSRQSATEFEPEEPQLMRHIAQLKPLMTEYSDVIAVLQAGFIGCWGEWYYTTHFIQGPVEDDDFLPRKRVVEALLDALPATREVSLRTPTFKKRMYKITSADSITVKTAHNGSTLSRLSGHNDCFGASLDDLGTFRDKDDRALWKADTRYCFMGGETCQRSSYCMCEISTQDVVDYHWTYLNSEYNRDVLQRWKDGGCYDDIILHLGYRLSLVKAWFTPEPKAGEKYDIKLRIENDGYAAPVNPRGAEIIFKDGSGKTTVFPLGSDPRTWFEASVSKVDTEITIPAGAKGHCTVYLNLPDPEKTLHDNPLFSIRLANTAMWEEATGFNKIVEFDL